MTYLIYIIKAYNVDRDTNNISDSVVIELIDETPEKALQRAKGLVERSNFQLTDIIEKQKNG